MPQLGNGFIYIYNRRVSLMQPIFSEVLTYDKLNQQWAQYFDIEIRARKLGSI